MSQNLDPYAVLGVSHTATPEQISHAFRTKVRALHPDTGPAGPSPSADATAQFRQLLVAYEALRRCGRSNTNADPAEPARAPDSQVPVRIPITFHRGSDPAFQEGLWAGPVHRHR